MNNDLKKITLHYIWFEDYGPYKNTGINLSGKYNFRYDKEKNKLYNSEENSEYFDGFYGKNIDLSVIVGENGTGKTTFLRFLLYLNDKQFIHIPCVIVYECNKKIIPVKFFLNDDNIITREFLYKISDNELYDKKYSINDLNRIPHSKNVRFIYLTDIFNYDQYLDRSSPDNDLSFGARLFYETIKKSPGRINNPVLNYSHEMFKRQIEFFLSSKCRLDNTDNIFSDFKYPEFAYISFNHSEDEFEKYFLSIKKKEISESHDQTDIDEEKIKKEARILYKEFIKKDVEFNYKEQIAQAIFSNIIKSLKYEDELDERSGYLFLELIDKCKKCQSSFGNMKTFLQKIKINNDTNNIYIPIKVDEYLFFAEYIENSDFQYFYTENKICISTEEIQEFYSIYKDSVSITDYLDFSWNLSSGEMILLNVFSKIMSALKSEENRNGKFSENENVVLLFDEVEVALHPEWQRKYFNSVLEFIKYTVDLSNTHVQMIFATHSPIILSDILKQNIVYLKKDDECKRNTVVDSVQNHSETFGANIYSLYNNAFFLEKGAIGEFASKYINDLIDEIKNLDNKSLIPKLENKMSIIGDDFIKKQLETMLRQFKNTNTKSYADFVDGMSLKEKKEIMEILQKSIETNEAATDD